MLTNSSPRSSRTVPDRAIELDAVVVGVDDEPGNVLDWIEQQRIRSLHLVHAISPTMELLEASFQVDVRTQIDAANEWLGAVASDAHRFVDEVSYHVVEDSIPMALVQAASSVRASAIVVGSGRRHGPGTLVGAPVGHLIHRSEFPVIVVPEPLGPDAERPADASDPADGPRPVIVALDEFADASALLSWTTGAVASGIPIEVVAAVSPTVLAIADAPEAMASIERLLRDRLAAALPADFDGPADIVFERPLDADVGASTRASMLVLASRRRRRIEGALTGSVVHHLPVISSCPIALVPLPEI